MTCDPSSNDFKLPDAGPPPTLPSLQSPMSVPKTPYPDVFDGYAKIPNIDDLISKLTTVLPFSITIIPNANGISKDMWSGLSDLFTQISPFLAMYKFIQPLFNVIIGIIDVICALLNPFALFDAVTKLFKKYIPEFLSMFPQTALLIVMIALLLLLIQIIEYMITSIEDIINQIIANIDRIQEANQRNDYNGIISATKKVSNLLCMFQNLMSLLSLFQGVFAIIQPLLMLAGAGLCDSSSGCCGDDYCPPFIRNNSESSFSYSSGTLRYYPQIIAQIPSGSDFDFLRSASTSLRNESWQFYDANSSTYNFANVITPSPKGFIFWHNNDTYDETVPLVKIPYTVDLTMHLNPTTFGHADTGGARNFVIKNCIVRSKPTQNVIQYNNSFGSYISGVISIEGGLVYEEDGSTPYNISGSQAKLDNFIHLNSSYSISLPSIDDAILIHNITFSFKWNPPVLVEQQLISMMCQGSPAQESILVNANLDTRSVIDKIGIPPDVGSVIGDLNICLNTFKSSINKDSATQFSNCTSSILNQLKNDSTTFICNAIVQSEDRFESQGILYPDLQFIDLPINISVVLKDKTGSLLVSNVTSEIGSCVANSITAKVTLGEISDFNYDGYGTFNGSITAKVSGTGIATVYVNKQSLAKILNSDNFNIPTEISESVFPYEFISSVAIQRRTIVSEESGSQTIHIELEV
jgi:hypothetical protein